MKLLDIDFHLLLINSLWCLGLFAISEPGKLFRFIPNFFLKNDLWSGIGMPIILCVTCMASVHGTIFYWSNLIINHNIMDYYDGTDMVYSLILINVNWFLHCVVLAFVNTLLFNLYEYTKRL